MHVVKIKELISQCTLEKDLSFLCNAFKEELFIREHGIVAHVNGGYLFETPFAEDLQYVPSGLIVPTDDIKKESLTFFLFKVQAYLDYQVVNCELLDPSIFHVTFLILVRGTLVIDGTVSPIRKQVDNQERNLHDMVISLVKEEHVLNEPKT